MEHLHLYSQEWQNFVMYRSSLQVQRDEEMDKIRNSKEYETHMDRNFYLYDGGIPMHTFVELVYPELEDEEEVDARVDRIIELCQYGSRDKYVDMGRLKMMRYNDYMCVDPKTIPGRYKKGSYIRESYFRGPIKTDLEKCLQRLYDQRKLAEDSE